MSNLGSSAPDPCNEAAFDVGAYINKTLSRAGTNSLSTDTPYMISYERIMSNQNPMGSLPVEETMEVDETTPGAAAKEIAEV